MSLLSICQWIQDTPIGTGLRESIWMFPIVESTHVLALSLSVGTLFWMDLRLTGTFMKKQPMSQVSRSVLPWTLIGFTIMTITGIFLFWCQAVKAYNSIFFKMKIAMLVLAAVNAIAYHSTIYLKMDEWDKAMPPPARARFAGWASIVLWIGIIICGRTMAYNF
ncbi:MAG: hypothetical protein LAP40_01650 [Acidobacteriia bacterium]|nr:hypothetical protein [Terriglobia bacterium]